MKKAFTMAEILISLTIIGVIAAITLPALQANINEKTWATQRKALYSRMSQAISMLPSLNGYGIGATQDETNEKAAIAFVTEGLNSVLKIKNICDSTNLSKCGLPDKITPLSGNKFAFPTNLTELNPMFTGTFTYENINYSNPQKNVDTNVSALETKNGESIAVFYNPLCQVKNDKNYSQPKMCANFVYDLNGKKGPNKVGKDIGFITALYSTESEVVAPMPLIKNAKAGTSSVFVQSSAVSTCRTQDSNSRIPNKEELAAIFYNKRLLGMSIGNYWSGTLYSAEKAWYLSFDAGIFNAIDRSTRCFVRCIKR